MMLMFRRIFLRPACLAGLALLLFFQQTWTGAPASERAPACFSLYNLSPRPKLSLRVRQGPPVGTVVCLHPSRAEFSRCPAMIGSSIEQPGARGGRRGCTAATLQTWGHGAAMLLSGRKSGAVCRNAEPVGRFAGLPNLRAMRRPDELLDVLDQFVVNGTEWTLSAQDAAVSLHFLYRAARSGRNHGVPGTFVVKRQGVQPGKPAPARRFAAERRSEQGSTRRDRIVVALSLAVAAGLRRSALEPKYLSMALTALADEGEQHRVAYRDVFRLGAKSIQQMVRESAFGHMRSRREGEHGEAREPASRLAVARDGGFTAQTMAMLATAYAKSSEVDEAAGVFEALALLLKQKAPEQLSARPLGMLLKAFARANALSCDGELVRVLCAAVEAQPLDAFDAQAATDVIFALARLVQQPLPRASHAAGSTAEHKALEHVVAAVLLLTPAQLAGSRPGGSTQAVSVLAALCSALVGARVTEEAVLGKVAQAVLAVEARFLTAERIATIMFALAAAGHRDAALTKALTDRLLQLPLRSVEARAAANIAWCAAVEDSMDPALLCWIWRSLDLLLGEMQADGLSQVHQFLLHAHLSNFTREDVYAAFYGTRAAPEGVRQTLNAKEESAEQRCRREFVNESLQQRAAQRSSRLHAHVSDVLLQVAPPLLRRALGARADGGAATARGAVGGGGRGGKGVQEVVEEDGQDGGLGGEWLVHEYIDPASGYSFDLFIPALSLVIEVDGPTHFDWKGERPLGATVMKHRQLRRLGFRVVSVSYREWEEAGAPAAARTDEGRRTLLVRKLQDALAEG